MNAQHTATQPSFVVLEIGHRRFALPSNTVVELAPPVRLHRFPHTSRFLAGVIVRRGRIIPVYDAASLFGGRSSVAQRFYLIARRQAKGGTDLGAIAVNGECELASGEVLPASADHSPWVAGTLALHDDSVEVLNFSALAASGSVTASRSRDGEPQP
ncbi:MAG TPA: chemotaxis protein CheW [Candidatus Acidoferrales bacterium]|nr:chemotaxis protein CheW [Candidatus Acidoferrales bacterium]